MATPAWLHSDKQSKTSTYIFDGAQKQEHERLEAQSRAINTLMHNKPLCAPVRQPRRILEIGCGTGLMTTLIARAFPDSQVYGLDPLPVPPIHAAPANVEFIQGTFEDVLARGDARLEPASFDYVFCRMLGYVVQDWSTFVARVSALLSPGGWFEQQEPDFYVHYSAASPDRDVGAQWKWPAILRDSMAAASLDSRAGSALEEHMSDAELVEVSSTHFPFVHSPWPGRPETDEMARYTARYVPPTCQVLLRRFCEGRYPSHEIEEMCQRVERDLVEDTEGLHWRWYTCVGQKPRG